jgi:hypothetical protein
VTGCEAADQFGVRDKRGLAVFEHINQAFQPLQNFSRRRLFVVGWFACHLQRPKGGPDAIKQHGIQPGRDRARDAPA